MKLPSWGTCDACHKDRAVETISFPGPTLNLCAVCVSNPNRSRAALVWAGAPPRLTCFVSGLVAGAGAAYLAWRFLLTG